jgi:TonB family protein
MIERRALVICPALLAALAFALPARAAECPVALKSLLSAGQAASRAFVSYQLQINGAVGAVSSVRFALRTPNGDETQTTTWTNAELAYPDYEKKETPVATGTFDRATSDVTAAAIDQVVTTAGQPPIACDRVWVNIGGPDDHPNEFVLINDQKHALHAQTESYAPAPRNEVDSELIDRVKPDYPTAEQKAGVQGDVTVRVTVGADGTPQKPVIYSSSQDDAIDLAALNAVRKSTFRATTIDGKPVQQDYLLVYTFRIDDYPRIPVAKPTCSLTLETMVLTNPGQPKGPDWYLIGVEASRSDVVSAELAFFDTAGQLTKFPWNSIALPPLGKEKTVHATAAIAWVGGDPLKAWVDKVTYADGTTVPCATYYELVDRPDASAPLPRGFNLLTKIDGVVSELTDPPAVATYPKYPSRALAADETGVVDVDVLVSRSGAVVGALVVVSSKHPDLDAAALAAAMKSKYPAVKNSQVFPTRVFEVEYDFQDQPT